MIGSAASSGSTTARAVIAARPRPPPQLVLLEPPQLVLAEPPQLVLDEPPQLVLDKPPQLVVRAKAALPSIAPATDIGRPPLFSSAAPVRAPSKWSRAWARCSAIPGPSRPNGGPWGQCAPSW